MRIELKKKKYSIIGFFLLLILIILFLEKPVNNLISKNKQLKKNIILIVSDALRKDILGCYGGKAKTPNIDKLAKRGILFENAYTISPVTIPSSVVLLTGNHSGSYSLFSAKVNNTTKKFFFHVNNKDELFSEILRKNGYDVKMDIENPLAKSSNNTQGFENLYSFKLIKKFDIFKMFNLFVNNQIKNIEKKIGILKSVHELPRGHSNDYLRTYSILDYILTIPNKKNFFILKWFMDPHAPYNPLKKFREKIKFNPVDLIENKNYYSRNNVRKLLEREKKGKEFTKEEISYIKSLYIAEIESVDERVGYIMKALEIKNLLNNTIIIFTSDHGEFFNEHGELGHSLLYYDQLIRIPLIISGSGIPAGERIVSRVSNMDIIPTLKELMKMNYKSKMSGKSFKDLLLNQESNPNQKTIYFDTLGHSVKRVTARDAILYKEFKLIITRNKGKTKYELYNIISDPAEENNLASFNLPLIRKMLSEVIKNRNSIRNQYKINLKKKDNTKLDKKWEKTKKHLKTLGYI